MTVDNEVLNYKFGIKDSNQHSNLILTLIDLTHQKLKLDI